jgi:transcriptional regulator with AAA-type ATPase domain
VEFLNSLKSYSWPGNVRELNSLLNSVVDYFGDISPTPTHIDAIRKSRQEVLIQSVIAERDDPSQLLKIKSQNILITVQNILRAVKIEMQPLISRSQGSRYSSSELESVRQFISRQSRILDELCLEPAYFKQWEIFEATTNYRHLLEDTIEKWPLSGSQLKAIWTSELKILDESINKSIMDVIWGRIDM